MGCDYAMSLPIVCFSQDAVSDLSEKGDSDEEKPDEFSSKIIPVSEQGSTNESRLI